MNKIIREGLIFAAGFVGGACFMHMAFEKKYRAYYDERYEADRKYFEQKAADMDAEIETKATQKSMEQLVGKYRTESDPEDIVKHDEIEIIEPDCFGENDEYETSFLTFYADGKLVFDGEDKPVDDVDIPKLIGTEALKHFGEFMPSAIHVRNNNYHKDYEILQVRQNWCDLNPDEEDE